MSEWADKVARSCLQHVVGSDGKNCRNCGLSAAWIEEQNRWRASSYRVPGSWPRKRIEMGSYYLVHLSARPIPLSTKDWIEVVW